MGCVIEDQSGTKVLMDYGLAHASHEVPIRSTADRSRYNHPQYIDHIGMAPAGRPPWNNSSREQADIWSLGNNVARHIQGFQH